MKEDPIRIGASACVLGHEIRYDGGHKLDHFVRDTLGRFVQFVHVQPVKPPKGYEPQTLGNPG